MIPYRNIQKIIVNRSTHKSVSEQLNSDYYLTCLYLAQLSYFDDEVIRHKLNKLQSVRVAIYHNDGCKCYIADFSDLVVVSFRGTIRKPKLTLKQNLQTAFKFWTKKLNDVYVHRGFLQQLESIEHPILADLITIPHGKRVLYVGHSLGGALAILLSLKHTPTDLCVFGSPRVALKYNLSQYFDGVNFHRVSTKWDLISFLPPYIPLILPYKHYGHQKILESEFSIKSILHPHRLINYLTSLKK